MDNEAALMKRFKELADRSYRENIYTYTSFLTVAEQETFHKMARELQFIPSELFGGNSSCERQMVGFGSEALFGYPGTFPICLICVKPLIDKFSDDFSHRDFLGALLNLGIERHTLGDIVVKPKRGYIYCTETIAPFIIDHLGQVKHTHVSCEIVDNNIEDVTPVLEQQKLIVASPRLDAVAAALTKRSRGQILDLFRTKKIFLNGVCEENNSRMLKTGDVLSIRGFGKCIYDGVLSETKKGRQMISIRKYI